MGLTRSSNFSANFEQLDLIARTRPAANKRKHVTHFSVKAYEVMDWLQQMDGVASYVEFHPESGIGLIVVSNMHHRSVHPGGKIHALMRRISATYR